MSGSSAFRWEVVVVTQALGLGSHAHKASCPTHSLNSHVEGTLVDHLTPGLKRSTHSESRPEVRKSWASDGNRVTRLWHVLAPAQALTDLSQSFDLLHVSSVSVRLGFSWLG